MTASSPFLKLPGPCDEAVTWATGKLTKSGLQVVRTFDLQAARLAHMDCPCPHHGTRQCNCQMVVLLVYMGDSPPLSIAIHGTGKSNSFHLVNIPQHSVGLRMEENIRAVLSVEIDIKA